MPIPIIIGAAALVSAAYGAKKGYDGYQKHSEAGDIVNSAKNRYAERREKFDAEEKRASEAIEKLGEEELRIGQQFNEFKTLANDLLKKLNNGRQDKFEINIPKHKLQRVENYSHTALGVLGAAAGAGAAGAAAGFAVYGGVMALGAASTGTAISSLAGAAATNATLAAIGGGSLATGGLGMAGGTAILGAAVVGPVLAIAGWAYDSHGDEALKNAYKASNEADRAIAKLKKAQLQLIDIEHYASEILGVLKNVYQQFDGYFNILKAVSQQIEACKVLEQNPQEMLDALSNRIVCTIENGFALAAIIVDLITTPLFKVKQANGEVIKNNNGIPEMELDIDGSMILNVEQLDIQLDETKVSAAGIEPA